MVAIQKRADQALAAMLDVLAEAAEKGMSLRLVVVDPASEIKTEAEAETVTEPLVVLEDENNDEDPDPCPEFEIEPGPEVASVETEDPESSSDPDLEPEATLQPEPRSPSAPSSMPSTDWRAELRSLLPTLQHGSLTAADEASILHALVRDREQLLVFPPNIQVSLLEYAAARMRARQDAGGLNDNEVRQVIGAIAAFAQSEKCGCVHGPKRGSRPKKACWSVDADFLINGLYDRSLTDDAGTANVERILKVLGDTIGDAAPYAEIRPLIESALRLGVPPKHRKFVRLCAPFVAEMLAHTTRFRSLYKAIRDFEREAEAKDVAPVVFVIPEDWPWFWLTRGKRAVMVGGDPREQNRDRIEKAFGFSELVWDSSQNAPRTIQALRESIERDGVDFLIILSGLAGHDINNLLIPACNSSKTPYVRIPRGYGIQRIRTEIEIQVPRPVAV